MIVQACKHENTKKVGKNKAGNPRVRCTLCGKTWTLPRPTALGAMRIEMELAERIVKQLCEGTSVRATARLTNTDPHTVIDLMNLVGGRCARYMAHKLRGIPVKDIQVDEVWQFVYCKQKTADRMGFGQGVGDSYCFTAIERNTKLLVAWHFGKRDQWNTDEFCAKLATATSGRFQISTDGYAPYLSAVVRYLGHRVEHGTVVKNFGKVSQEDQRKYSAAKIISIKKEAAWNLPNMDRVCTSHVERHNLTLRTFIKRMARLSCSFSKKWANHEAMLGLAIFHYNYCRTHGTLKTTPAVKSGIENHRWTVREMIERTADTT
jgi:IS1 family transposase/transposase-like protein